MCFDPHNLKHGLWCVGNSCVIYGHYHPIYTVAHIGKIYLKKKNTKNRHFVVSRPFVWFFFFFWLAEVRPATEEISVRPPNRLIHSATRIQDGWGAAVAAIRLHPVTLVGQVRV